MRQDKENNQTFPLSSFSNNALLANREIELWDAFKSERNENTNIHKTARGFLIEILAPGFSNDEVHVQLNHRRDLTISFKKVLKNSFLGDYSELVVKGFSCKDFVRRIDLPFDVDQDEIWSIYKGGVLYIEIEKDNDLICRSIRVPVL